MKGHFEMDGNYTELDRKIERLQGEVFKKRDEYNTLMEELAELIDERYPERRTERIKESLYEAYRKSGRSLDEIIELIQDADCYI